MSTFYYAVLARHPGMSTLRRLGCAYVSVERPSIKEFAGQGGGSLRRRRHKDCGKPGAILAKPCFSALGLLSAPAGQILLAYGADGRKARRVWESVSKSMKLIRQYE